MASTEDEIFHELFVFLVQQLKRHGIPMYLLYEYFELDDADLAI